MVKLLVRSRWITGAVGLVLTLAACKGGNGSGSGHHGY
jgi:hypothetical protein